MNVQLMKLFKCMCVAYNLCTAIANKVCVAKNLDFVFFCRSGIHYCAHSFSLAFRFQSSFFDTHLRIYLRTVIRSIFAFMFRHFLRAFSIISSSHQYESISDISCFEFVRHFGFYSSTHCQLIHNTFSE